MNKVILLGRLTADPEVRYTQTGKTVTTFTLAINRPKAKDAETAEADFIRCQCWGTTAELVGNSFAKGKLMLCSGSLRSGSYEKDGKKIFTLDVNIKEVFFVEPKNKSTNNTEAHYDNAKNDKNFKQPEQSDFGSFGTSIPFDEEIPF